jgi:methyltransferase family protein
MGLKNQIAVYSSRHYDSLKSVFGESLLQRCGIRRYWHEIDGWFTWREAQEEAVTLFPDGSRFVEVGTYLGRSLCSLGEVIERSGKNIAAIGVDTCRGSGPEGLRGKDYHARAAEESGGTFAGALHKNVVDCGFADKIVLVIADSVSASRLFADAAFEWVHLDARHDYASVKADIEAWLPKVKAGGWLSGDDYNEEKWPEVVKAVNDMLPGAKPWGNEQWRWRL